MKVSFNIKKVNKYTKWKLICLKALSEEAALVRPNKNYYKKYTIYQYKNITLV